MAGAKNALRGMVARCWLAGCCLALGWVALGALPCPAEDWPRWRGPRGDGTWQAPPLPERWPEAGLAQRWRQPIGGGYAGVVVADGRAITMDRQPADEASGRPEVERVLAFDAQTGAPLWTYEYPVRYQQLDYGNGPRAAPTIEGDRVYTLGALGNLACLEAATGQAIWSIDAVAEWKAVIPQWGLAASPLVLGDQLIVHAGVPGGCFQALDRHTGRELWRSGDDPAGYATPIRIDAPGGPQLVGWTPLHIVGIDPARGTLLWKIPYEVTYGVSIATPVYHAGLVFVAGYWEGSKAIRPGGADRPAELAWDENRQLRGLMSQPLCRDGFAYLLDKQHGLTCFELATGEVRWNDGNRLTPRGRNPQASLVWLGAGERMIALNAEGELVLARLNAEGYQETSRTRIIGPTWAHPAFAGRAVFARDDAELVCVELPTEE